MFLSVKAGVPAGQLTFFGHDAPEDHGYLRGYPGNHPAQAAFGAGGLLLALLQADPVGTPHAPDALVNLFGPGILFLKLFSQGPHPLT